VEVINIKIKLRLLGPLKKYKGDKISDNNELEIPEDYTVKDLINQMGIPPEKAKVILVNEESKKLNYSIKEGDRLAIFSFIGGG